MSQDRDRPRAKLMRLSPLMALVSFVVDPLRPPWIGPHFHGSSGAGQRLPRNPVTDRLTGGADRAVGITYGTAPGARRR